MIDKNSLLYYFREWRMVAERECEDAYESGDHAKHDFYEGVTSTLGGVISHIESNAKAEKTVFYEDEKTYTGAETSNYICKNCGYIVGTWHKGLIPDQMFHFCPWCGAENEGWTGGIPTDGSAE